jgi:CopG family nickel-responsive transcriptional regulator
MADITRMSLSIETSLLHKLESLLAQKDYGNRSEFVRDLIRERLVEEEWNENEDVVGTITMIFDHHARELQKKLTNHQHNHHSIVLATTHLHLSHDICLEVIMSRGSAAEIQHLYEGLRQQKGVLHVALSMTSTGDKLK